MDADITIAGHKELEALFLGLPRQVKKVMRQCFQEALVPVVKDLQANAAALGASGTLSRAITTDDFKGKRSELVVRAGVNKHARLIVTTYTTRGGRKRQRVTRRPIKYAHLLELGTRPHRLGKGQRLRKDKMTSWAHLRRLLGGGGRQHPGTKPQPFVREAWEGSEAEALKILQEAYHRRVQEWIDKEAKKAERAAKRAARKAKKGK